MKYFAETGEMVQYTGDTSYATHFTAGIMARELIPGNWYKVELARCGMTGWYYRFTESGYLYPCKSFIRDFVKYYKNKYGLK